MGDAQETAAKIKKICWSDFPDIMFLFHHFPVDFLNTVKIRYNGMESIKLLYLEVV